MRRLVIFLIRRRLGVKKYEVFKFSNQKSNTQYFFTKDHLVKIEWGENTLSNVSLNWLLDNECSIESVREQVSYTQGKIRYA